VSERAGPDHGPVCPEDPSEPDVAVESPPDATLQLLAEDALVTKEVRESGRVRVATVTRERQVLVDEELVQEHVEIETIPVGRQVETMPEVRHEGDRTVVPVVEEVVVVERRLMLKEEIHIKRVRAVERHQEWVTLRRQEAVVTREPAGTATSGSGSDDDGTSVRSQKAGESKTERG
jgi:stress response protein YsnF